MKFRTSPRFPLSPRKRRLLEWLCDQYLNGLELITFQRGDEREDARLKQLEMKPADVETVAKRLEAWGREYWNINPKCNSGTPPLRVEREGDELRLIVAPQIEDICSSYRAWLESQQSDAEGR